MGGVMDLPEEARKMGAPPNWSPYVIVPDLEATCAKAAELGGSVFVPPHVIPNVGTIAVLADPQGAVFYLFKAAGDAPGHDNRKGPGEVSWHELATTDHEAALGFYGKLFGWTKGEAMSMGPAGVYQLFGRGEQILGGMFNKTEDFPGPCRWVMYFNVEDIDAAVELVRSIAGVVLMDVMEVPGGEFVAHCTDPQGAHFALHAYTRK